MDSNMEDADPIKMFIGQICKTMDEDELKSLLEEYGPLQSVNILRDRGSGQSKGCAFATFFRQKDALAAQNALNNVKVMPGLKNPIQIKPADGQGFTLEERKVFVGMLSKSLVESDVTMMFAPFGNVEDCSVVKDHEGNSKGCAFLTFGTRQSAMNAIKSMHHSQTMKGCKAPLVVKFADTQKEKEARRMVKQQMGGGGGGGIMGGFGAGNMGGGDTSAMSQMAQYMGMMQQQQQQQPFGNNAMMAMMALMTGMGGMNPQQMQQLFTAAAAAAPMLQANPMMATMLAAFMSNPGGVGNPNNPMAAAFNNGLMQQLQQAFQSQGGQADGPQSDGSSGLSGFVSGGTMSGQSSAGQSGSTAYDAYGNRLDASGGGASAAPSGNWVPHNAASAGSTGSDMMNKAYSGFQQYLAAYSGSSAASANNTPGGAAGSQQEGPEGANLFIYHLPPEFGDHDLVRIFSPYGRVVSAKVFVDKLTNTSKCFGFVSYDDAISAQSAIQSMNGTSVGSRRLKVTLKNNKEKNKPY